MPPSSSTQVRGFAFMFVRACMLATMLRCCELRRAFKASAGFASQHSLRPDLCENRVPVTALFRVDYKAAASCPLGSRSLEASRFTALFLFSSR